MYRWNTAQLRPLVSLARSLRNALALDRSSPSPPNFFRPAWIRDRSVDRSLIRGRASECGASPVDADAHSSRTPTARGELPPPLLVYARRVNVSSGLYRWSITRATRSCANVEFYVVLDRSEVAGSLVTRAVRCLYSRDAHHPHR